MKKKTISLILLAALCAALAGCGSGNSIAAMATESAAGYSGDDYYAADTAAGFGGRSSDSNAAELLDDSQLSTERKIIYTSYLTVETRTFDESHSLLQQKASELGGYLESSSLYGSADNGSRSASETYRIPADNYQDFLNAAGDIGSMTYRSEQTEDITGQYVDVQARLDSLKTQRDRLEELRDKAETLEDLLTIESSLSDVQYQLESYTAQLNLYDDQVDYCTVTISLEEVDAYTPNNTFTSRLESAFGNSWSRFVEFLQNAVISLIYLLPYLILLAVLAILLFVICRHLPKRPARKQMNRGKAPSGAASYEPLYPAAPHSGTSQQESASESSSSPSGSGNSEQTGK